jgi:hypothetical protein
MIIRNNIDLQCAGFRADCLDHRDKDIALARRLRDRGDSIEDVRAWVRLARVNNHQAIDWGRKARGAC